MINEATKINLSVAVFGGVIWAFTGTWQFFAVAAGGALCTWMFTSPSDRPQPRPRKRVREFVRVEIRDVDKVAACYDYGGCKWVGDGCAGGPVVLGPGEGCTHTGRRRTVVHPSQLGKRSHDEDATENGGYLRRPQNCACDNVPCTCSPRDRMVGDMWRRSRHAACEQRGRCTCWPGETRNSGGSPR